MESLRHFLPGLGLLLLVAVGCVETQREITPDQARLVAEQKAQSIQWTPELTLLDGLQTRFTVSIVKYDTPDSECLPKWFDEQYPDNAAPYAPVKARLIGKSYFAVMYNDNIGPVFCFFVDRRDGSLITWVHV